MRSVLHVGSGFRPWVVNGLVLYAEELMAAQRTRGMRVGYFFPGRHYPLVRRPRLHRWSRDGIRMFEWLSSPIVVGALSGTLDPAPELDHAGAEEVFARVLDEHRPDVVHVHDLGGLPSSLVDVAHDHGTRIVMSLHDYFLLCPTVRLFDVEGRICHRQRPGAECARCCSDAPRDNVALRDRTLRFEGIRARRAVPGLATALGHPIAARGMARLGRSTAERQVGPPRAAPPPDAPPSAPPEAYDRRRSVNVERLGRFDRLLTLSPRSADLYAELGVPTDRMRHVNIASGHLDRLRPRRVAGSDAPAKPLTFATLGAMTSRQKGSDTLVAALRRLREWGLDDRYRMLIGGWVPPELEPELRSHPGVVIRGLYDSEHIDEVLRGVDVGVIPSVWEEVSPITGREFLALGIPLVANALGGLVDYTREGETGWLNHASDADGLAAIMRDLIAAPDRVVATSRAIAERRDELVISMDAHVREVDAVYAEVAGD